MIKILTLKTNHSIIGDVSLVHDLYTIKKPVQVVIQPTQNGPSLAFVPFIEFCKEFETGIEINKNDVLFLSTPIVEVENQYNKIFGSGIEIVGGDGVKLAR
jgi:hypothetical protein